MVVTGDVTQIDLPSNRQSGLRKPQISVVRNRRHQVIYLTQKDVVRHRLVKAIVKHSINMKKCTKKAAFTARPHSGKEIN